MKRSLLFVLCTLLFAACSDFNFNDTTNNGSNGVEDNNNTSDDEDIIPGDSDTIKIEVEEDDTRTQLMDGKTVFSYKDAFSVFYRSDSRREWLYDGEPGTTSGTITAINPDTLRNAKDIVVVYPHSNYITRNIDRGTVQAYLPTQQSYLPDSYGIGSSVMVGCSEQNKVTMRNVVGWVKFKLRAMGRS